VTDLVIETVASLDAETIRAVQVLVDQVTAHDLVRPLNEAAELALHHAGVAHYVIRTGQRVVGYAQQDPALGTAQLCVHPDARGAGLGTALCTAVLADAPGTELWAFGNLRAAQAIATKLGYVSVRELLILERPLTLDESPAPVPEGITIRGFQPDDEAAILAVNAAAFAHHPEQGGMDHANFVERTEQPWFEPEGLLVAVDATGTMLGFHWTKRHGPQVGEVYVIATAPDAAGKGLGSALLTAGLAHLAAVGCTHVILYVESDNAALRLYRRHGFVVARSDVVYAPPERQSR
jgi:mycothiol synthase